MVDVSRKEWGARRARQRTKIDVPLRNVWIHHTVSANKPTTVSFAESAATVRAIQDTHMDQQAWSDIGYSFLIDAAGRVFAGRGWGISGGHTRGQNSSSHAIAFIGTFTSKKPSRKARQAARELIKRGIKKGMITRSPRLDGHRNAPNNATTCPGDGVMAILDELLP